MNQGKWSSDFRSGFFIGLGVGVALLVLSVAGGIVRKA